MPDSADQPYFLITRYERIARMKGFSLRPGDRVLDFGCGSGAMVYRLRDAGYDASGFDIMDTLSLRNPGDMKLFSIAPNPERFDKANPDIRHPPVYRFDWSGYRLPFDDNEFDFVVSQETFEHVMDPAAAIRELARVTKPGGFHIHTFPGRWQVIEPHIYVPLGGLIRRYDYYHGWAALGVRNPLQTALTARETAAANLRYATGSLNYPPPHYFRTLGARWFDVSEFVPELWEAEDARKGPVLRNLSVARWLYTRMKEVVWFLGAPLRQ